MLAGQVASPVDGELELVSVGHGLFQYFDTLGVGQAHELRVHHALQALYQARVYHLVEEGQVVPAIIQRPLHAVLDELFFQVHQFVQVGKGHLGLNHPELGQVTRRVGVLGTESRPERIDGAQGSGCQLAFQLAGHRQAGLLAKEVVIVDDGAVLVLLQVVEVHRSHLKHLSGALAV